MERYLHTIYCDDIRAEVGNKQSLMGIYSSDLLVPEFPIVLPKLCIVASLFTRINKPFKKLTIKVTKDNETLIEAPITDGQLNQLNIIENGNKDSLDRRIGLALNFVLAQFALEKECNLRVLAITESGELKGNGLKIKIGQPPEMVN